MTSDRRGDVHAHFRPHRGRRYRPVATATPRDNAFSARLAAIAYARWLVNGGTEGGEDSP
ncbi:hypothetical protein ACGFWD_41215 [Streptomyces sp. NPDC048448]|uniref:hypothetical protein n=1 Tax=Streptomyces sp. NPDC048448 TaxID=3365554 RepID=UPI003717B910